MARAIGEWSGRARSCQRGRHPGLWSRPPVRVRATRRYLVAGKRPVSERFFAQWQPSPTPVLLKFRALNGATLACLVSICSRTGNDGSSFVLQCFPAGTLDAKGRIAGGDTALFQSQKFDRALQLARTVALDFNNALTGILGHTSLVLSKMEPNHPWRHSLVEVEKSAPRAAEIANDLGDLQPAGKGNPRPGDWATSTSRSSVASSPSSAIPCRSR